MVSTTTCVTYYVYLNVLGPKFLKVLLDQSALWSVMNLSYNYIYVISRKCLMWGMWFLETILNFSASLSLKECLALLCQKFALAA